MSFHESAPENGAQARNYARQQEKAFALLSSRAAAGAFGIATEPASVRERNLKKEPAEVRVVEHLEHLYRWTNWEIAAKSQDFEKKDAQTIEFRVPLKPDEEKTITCKVKYTW